MADEVVSGATETTESSSTDTQTTGEQVAETITPKERIELRKLIRDDPDVNAQFQSELVKARNRWQRQQLRNGAKAAVDASDKDTAFAVAQHLAAEEDEPDEGDVQDANWSQAADRVQPMLERILQLDKDGRATNPYYVQLHKATGRAEMDRRYAEDPAGFVNWVDDQIMEMRVDEKLKKVAPSLREAIATDEANRNLRGRPTPLTGAGASAALTLQQYEGMTFKERQELRKTNPRAIDEMINRAAR